MLNVLCLFKVYWRLIALEIMMGNITLEHFITIEHLRDEWTFARADTQYGLHGLHPYPARMIPQIASKALNIYAKDCNLVLDPFCGSGTVLVESAIHGMNAIGIDINPLAVFLSETKAKMLDPKVLKNAIQQLKECQKKVISQEVNTDERQVMKILRIRKGLPNIEYWFKVEVIRELAKLEAFILTNYSNTALRNILYLCLSLTARKVSNVYWDSDTFIKRRKKEELTSFNPNVIATFKSMIQHVHKKLCETLSILRTCKKLGKVHVIQANSLKMPLEDNSVDFVLTSPPYGEEKNTVSYTRWAKISLYWLPIEYFRKLELAKKQSLGASHTISTIIRNTLARKIVEISEELQDIVKHLKSKRKTKLLDNILAFFADYYQALNEIYRVLKSNRNAVIVIGDRSIAGYRVQMNRITSDFAKDIGFSILRIHYRRIPRKSIPWQCAKGETISKENIIVLRKV